MPGVWAPRNTKTGCGAPAVTTCTATPRGLGLDPLGQLVRALLARRRQPGGTSSGGAPRRPRRRAGKRAPVSSRVGRSTRTSHWYAQGGRGSSSASRSWRSCSARAPRRSRHRHRGVLPRVLVRMPAGQGDVRGQALGGDQLAGDPLGLAGLDLGCAYRNILEPSRVTMTRSPSRSLASSSRSRLRRRSPSFSPCCSSSRSASTLHSSLMFTSFEHPGSMTPAVAGTRDRPRRRPGLLIGGERVAGERARRSGSRTRTPRRRSRAVGTPSDEQVDAAIAAAAEAQRGWERTPAVERAETLHEVAARLRAPRRRARRADDRSRAASRWSRTPTRSAGPRRRSTTTPRSAATRRGG